MPSSRSPTVLLVDGYNVIGAWFWLQKIRDRDGLEAARYQLIETLVNYSAFDGLNTQVVFDAYYQDSGSSYETITPNLSVYYTDFGQTADTYIEKFSASFYRNSSQRQSRLIVATSDRAQRLTVVGYGAEWMSAQQLLEVIESTSQRMGRRQKPKKQSSSRFLVNSLDERSQQRLSELRKGLQ